MFFAEKFGLFRRLPGYHDVKSIFDDWQTFSSENAQAAGAAVRPRGQPDHARRRFHRLFGPVRPRIPPEHTRIRRIVQRCFGPKRFQAIEPRIREIVTQALDAIRGNGDANFHAEFAYDVPALVLFRLAGVPRGDVAKVKAWAVNRATLTWGDLSDDAANPACSRDGRILALLPRYRAPPS